jgi:hypothetical protein
VDQERQRDRKSQQVIFEALSTEPSQRFLGTVGEEDRSQPEPQERANA